MYYRLLASITRDHIRDHLDAYLDAASDNLDSNRKVPGLKTFDVASFVGGVAGVSGKSDFPAASIDAYNKIISTTAENLNIYRYDGHITWMVAGDNPKVVEQDSKAYGAAFEGIVRDHAVYPHDDSYNVSQLPFRFVEFGFLRSEFFGAAQVEVESKGVRRLWVDGGRIEIAWLTNESGIGQHGKT